MKRHAISIWIIMGLAACAGSTKESQVAVGSNNASVEEQEQLRVNEGPVNTTTKSPEVVKVSGDDELDQAVVFIEPEEADYSAPPADPRPEPKPVEVKDNRKATGGSKGEAKPSSTADVGGRDYGSGDGSKTSNPSKPKVKESKKKDKVATGGAETEVSIDEEEETAAAQDPTADQEYQRKGWTDYQAEAKKVGKVYTEPGRLPHLQVAFLDPNMVDTLGEDNNKLPLDHTHVEARIVGPVAKVVVKQKYRNPFDNVIEAVYIFPLPENAAVNGMRMTIGDRVIEGVIKKRAEARAMYEEAKAAGKVAALLEQERPNVFTQSVANIAPKSKIDIDIRYVQDLSYDSGQYEFVFPMVVGPRYLPEGSSADAAAINPPVLAQGDRSGTDISLELKADAGVPILNYEVPTHDVDASLDSRGHLALALATSDRIPNRDFVLRYKVASEELQTSVLSETVDDQGYLTLIVQPPDADINALVGTREVIFLVDVSGSMRGVPLSMSKEAMVDALRRLRPVDTFNIITFASSTTKLFKGARPVNQKNLQHASEFVENMESGGGTQMVDGIKAAIEASIDANMNRIVVFMTDGYIGNEDQVLQVLAEGVESTKKQGATLRLFAMGVGSSTNRYLIDGVADVGNGNASYTLNRESPTRTVDAIFSIIDKPILTGVELDFGKLDVERVYPSTLPDLMASRPLVIHARYTKGGKGKGKLTAKRGSESVELSFDLDLSSKAEHDGVLGTLWARQAIEQLDRDKLYSSDFQAIEEEITQLGLTHSLVTAYTSFVAIDHSQIVEGGGTPTKVKQGVSSPEGVSGQQ